MPLEEEESPSQIYDFKEADKESRRMDIIVGTVSLIDDPEISIGWIAHLFFF